MTVPYLSLHEIFQVEAPRPRRKPNPGPKRYHTIRGIEVTAATRSEARALVKKRLGVKTLAGLKE